VRRAAAGSKLPRDKKERGSCPACKLRVRLVDVGVEEVQGRRLADPGCYVNVIAGSGSSCIHCTRLDVPNASYRILPNKEMKVMCDFAVICTVETEIRISLLELKAGPAPAHAIRQLQAGLDLIASTLDHAVSPSDIRAYIVSKGADHHLKSILRAKSPLKFRESRIRNISVVRCGQAIEVPPS
jgi:hypothetical protein